MDSVGIQTSRETPNQGVCSGLVETAKDWDPEPRTRRAQPTAGEKNRANSRRSFYNATRGSETRGGERNTVLRVRKPTTTETKSLGQVDDHQHRPEGKLSQSEAEDFRDEDEANQPKIETVWFR